MAHFLKGNFKGFYKAGTSECVKDMIRFKKLSEGSVYMELTRRDIHQRLMETCPMFPPPPYHQVKSNYDFSD